MAEPSSASGIAALGIDIKGIIFQIINFLLLLLILKWIAYKPILKILDKRREKISSSLKVAKALEEKQRDWEKKEREMQRQASDKVQQILQDTQSQAKQESEAMLAKTKKQQEEILKKTQLQISQEKTKMLQDVKNKIAELVTVAAATALKQKINPEQDKQLIKDSLKQIK